MKNKLLYPTDSYNLMKSIPLNLAKSKYDILTILHFNSSETNLRWTSRIRDIQRKQSKSRLLQNFIAIYLDKIQLGRLLLAVDDQDFSILLGGYRYFGPERGWVDYVEYLDLKNLVLIEWHEDEVYN